LKSKRLYCHECNPIWRAIVNGERQGFKGFKVSKVSRFQGFKGKSKDKGRGKAKAR
jgi:hypothetical protein